MIRYFCSSDIHSFYDEWMTALTTKGFDINNSEHVVIVCGDLWDRGPKSRECYEFAKYLISQNRFLYVRGNHEDLLLTCIEELKKRPYIKNYHVSNGTVKTLCQFMNCVEYDLLCNCYDKEKFRTVTEELIDFINNNSKDYVEVGDTVFVHGWVPTTDDNGYEIVPTNWRNGDWSSARWVCGFDSWRCNLIPPDNKTVVCGHWHTSYGWSEFRGKSEWGADADFSPFIDKKIIAIDACTAYTNKVNVVVFDESGSIVE